MNFEFTNSKGITYFLHVVQSGKKGSSLFYFSKKAENGCPLPDDRVVVEGRTGLPVAKKKAT